MHAHTHVTYLYSTRDAARNCDATFSHNAGSETTACTAPTLSPYKPKFLEKEHATSISIPLAAKERTAEGWGGEKLACTAQDTRDTCTAYGTHRHIFTLSHTPYASFWGSPETNP